MAGKANSTPLYLHDLRCKIAQDSGLWGQDASPEHIAIIARQSIEWSQSARGILISEGFITNGHPISIFTSFDDVSYDNRMTQLSSLEAIAAFYAINVKEELDFTDLHRIMSDMAIVVAQSNTLASVRCATAALQCIFGFIQQQQLERKHSVIANEATVYGWAARMSIKGLPDLFSAVHCFMKALGSRNPNIADAAIRVRSTIHSGPNRKITSKAA